MRSIALLALTLGVFAAVPLGPAPQPRPAATRTMAVTIDDLPYVHRADTGFLANYTHVESTIQYVLTSANGVPLTFTKDDLVDLSPNTASGTLFYDNGTFSIRTIASYRDAYIRGLPASAGSDVRGNKANMFVDASASWNVNDHFTLILEGQNLTDERNTLFIDRSREDTLFQTEIGRTLNFGATFKF